LSIGEVAERVGLNTSALRYYERAGLLAPAERVGGRRRYDPETVELLLFLRFCQRVGFTLTEIRVLLGTPAKKKWRELVDAKLAEVDALIEHAQAVKQVLTESRDCDCVSLDRCSFVTGD
jgi:MerR family transcriptional regulator, redox-sensitive transcriptional activator SoxR